jgi:hypothetical protein
MPKKPISPTKTEDREKYTLWLDNDVLKRLRQYQEEVGVPVSVSVRKALEAYVNELKIPRR